MGTNSGRAGGGALFGATRQAVLRVLFSQPEERFFQRQIIRSVGLGSGTVQRELEQLTNAGILTRTVEGHQIYYQANRACPVYQELRGLVRKTFGLADVLRTALQSVARHVRFAFIFGSVAEGTEKPGSDIDLMVVGDKLSLEEVITALERIERELRREVNPTVYSAEEFCRKLSEGHYFISAVVREPKIFLIGDESELRGLAKEWMAERAPVKLERNRRSVRDRRP